LVPSYSPGSANVHPDIICGPLVHPSPLSKLYLDRFSHFCKADDCDKPTDQRTVRQTDGPRYSVCNNRPYLHSTAIRPNNNGYWTTRGYTNSRIANNSRTRQLADATGNFACLVFVFWPFIDVFLRVYLNIYYASDSVSCIICPRIA